jgi:F420-dependent oxidoreductase-like protein
MDVSVMPLPDPKHTLSQVLDTLAEMTAAGFGSLWLPQLPAMAGSSMWDPLLTLALAARDSPDAHLGTAVNVVYGQHPLVLARTAVTASAAAGGRLTLGLGVSHPAIVEALGYRQDRPATHLAEYLDALLPALAGEPVDVHGRFVTATGQLETAGAPAPAVVLAALGPRMLHIAGSRTDGTVTSWVGPRTLGEHIVPRLTDAAREAGRPAPRVIAGLPVVVTHDPDTVRARIDEEFAAAGQMPAYRAVLDREGVAGPGDVSIVGDEAHVAGELRRLADVGVTEFVGSPLGDAADRERTTAVLAALRAQFE